MQRPRPRLTHLLIRRTVTLIFVLELMLAGIGLSQQCGTLDASFDQSGASMLFSVVAAGIEPLSYQWRFNGAVIPDATSALFEIRNGELNQSGSYSVTVSNTAGPLGMGQ